MSFPLHPLRHRKRHLENYYNCFHHFLMIESHLVKLVPPTPNVIHQYLVGGELKLNRCPEKFDDDDDDHDDDDYGNDDKNTTATT